MWYCYLLKNTVEKDKNRTYIGYTNNIQRRIRQHNQELVGGARYTHRYGNKTWEIYALVYGLPDKINALCLEWRIKHPDNKRKSGPKYQGPSGRIVGLSEVLKLEKWTNNSIVLNESSNLTLLIHETYAHLVEDLPKNINVIPFTNPCPLPDISTPDISKPYNQDV
jgi:predicted GIY-YIG superfamily endonuclease